MDATKWTILAIKERRGGDEKDAAEVRVLDLQRRRPSRREGLSMGKPRLALPHGQ